MKIRLVLHLGLWKTGTKTIQAFLRKNPDLLAAHDIYYPKVLPDNPQHRFFSNRPASHFISNEINHMFLGQELAARRSGQPTNLPLWSTAFKRIESSGAHTAVISNESFSAKVSVYNFNAIAEQLKAFDVIGLIYLRPQEAWTVSLYSHEVRRAATSLSFDKFVESIKPRLTYSVLLDQIRDLIPLDSLIVRDFDAASRTDLIEDFFSSLGVPQVLSAADASYAVKNKSLPTWAVLFMLRCVQASLAAEHLSDIRKALMWVAANQTIEVRPGLDVASPAERAGLRAIMHADAARLAEKYAIAFAQPELTATETYRAFDKDDLDHIRAAITPRLGTHARTAVGDL
jgi:hypothetical protein